MKRRKQFVALLGCALAIGCASNPTVGTDEGALAPDFTVKKVGSDEKVSLASRKGKVVLLDFWATWCGPCKALEPEVEALYDRYKDKGFDVLAISSEQANLLDKFAKQRTAKYPIFQDFAGMATGAFQVTSLPTQVIIDKEGKVVWKQVGMEPGTLTKAVEEAMASS